MKQIVILGGGFGGLKAALILAEKTKRLPVRDYWQVLLIDQNSYHLYTPPLYEVATASSGDISALNLKKVVTMDLDATSGSGVKFLKGRAERIDLKNKTVSLQDGAGISYEYLLVALGTETNFFNIPGLKENSVGLKTLNDAIVIRNRLKTLTKQQKDVSVVIGGAGTTGVEFAGELAHWCKKAMQGRTAACKLMKITIVERAPTILPGFEDKIIKAATNRLQNLGVQIMTTTVKKASADSIEVVQSQNQKPGTRNQLPADLIVWSGGIQAPFVANDLPIEKTPTQRITCSNPTLEIYPGVFAVGDIISMCYPGTTKSVPANASLAIQEAEVAAENIYSSIIGKPLKSYEPPQNIPFIIPIGGRWAIAKIGNIVCYGFFAWLIKQLVELNHFLRLMNPFKAFWLWCQGLFFFTRND